MPWWKFWAQDGEGAGKPDYYEEGVSLVRQERFHDALTSFQLALRNKPNDPATLEQLATVYTRTNQPMEAIRAYQKALEIRPRSPSAHYGIAFLLLRSGDREAAETHLRTFLASEQANRDEDPHVQHARSTLQRLMGTAEGEPLGDVPGPASAPEAPPQIDPEIGVDDEEPRRDPGGE
jgi:Flp pilus assembly protein TadD